MKFLLSVFLCAAIWASVLGGPIVDTTYGSLEGATEYNEAGAGYDVFRGVPFAEAPVGSLRFTKPVPPQPWQDVRSALEFGPQCVQFILSLTNQTSEDCLYLNVYVPGGVENAADLPVMVWVYGGAYILGAGQWYDPEDLIMYGPVIVVTVNYRLGPIGFLSTEDAASPGNYGLWDVQASLLWLQENIAQFGGDPSRVTVFGQSAGGAITSHMAISPATQGLLHRAIPLSGAASGFFGITYPGEAAASTNTLALAVGCRRTNGTQEKVDCLRTVEANELDWWGFLSMVTLRMRLPNFVPVIDNDFVPQLPRSSWEDGAADDIDLMTGFTEHDSAAFTLVNPLGTNRTFNLAGTHARLRRFVNFVTGMYPEGDAAADAMYARYEAMSDNDTETRTIAATQAMTDWWFGSGSSQEAHLHSSTSSRNTYHYNFNYRHSFFRFPEEWVEGHHTGDLYSVFGEPLAKRFRTSRLGDYDEVDLEVTDTMMAYFTNFAASGNPNDGPSEVSVSWPSFSDNDQLLRFRSQPGAETEDPQLKQDYDFWNNDFMDIARPPAAEAEREDMTEEEFLLLVDEVQEQLLVQYQHEPELLDLMLTTMEYAMEQRTRRLQEASQMNL